MKKYLNLFFIAFSVFTLAQETSVNDTIQEKVLFQDDNLQIIRKTDENGKDCISVVYGGNTAIEISKKGEIKAQNTIITPNIQLTQIPYQEKMDLNYILDLDALEKHLKKYKTLPNFPSNNELQRDGIAVADFQMKLLKEIEELTLIIIDQNKRIEDLEKDIKKMKIILVNNPSR